MSGRKPRLTPNQRWYLDRLWSIYERRTPQRPIAREELGATEVWHTLARKGYVQLDTATGPRGGQHLFLTPLRSA